VAGLVRLLKVSIALHMLRVFVFVFLSFSSGLGACATKKNNGDYLKQDSVGRFGEQAGLCHEV